jgi:phenylpropionate dioxygenase-like ring-hydroxylating dioxygenase large terminal subunit
MIRNAWYIGCAGSRLSEAPLAIQILDQALVLFRDGQGRAHALYDRCVHRGVKLSLGTMTEGTLACGYHGWRYDGTGQCVHIPSLVQGQRIAAGCEVPSFPTVEQEGNVWVWVGDRPPSPAAPPAIADFGKRRWMQGSVAQKCAGLKGIENNLDWCHAFFAHPKTHGQYFATLRHGFRDQTYEMRVTERGMVVFAPATAKEGDPIPAQAQVKLTFELPDLVTVEFGRAEKGASMRERFGAGLMILMHFVPTGPSSCRLEWMMTNPVPFGGRLMWSEREPTIFRQDRVLLESAQPWYDKGDEFERSVEADAATLLARRIYQLACQGSWETHRASLPARRVVHVRA